MWTIVNGLLQTRMLMVCHPKIIFRFLSNIYALTPTDFHCYVGSSGVQDETNDLDNVFLIQNSLRINRSLPVLGYLRDYSYLWEFIWIAVDDILGTSFVLYRVNKSLFLRSHTAPQTTSLHFQGNMNIDLLTTFALKLRRRTLLKYRLKHLSSADRQKSCLAARNYSRWIPLILGRFNLLFS